MICLIHLLWHKWKNSWKGFLKLSKFIFAHRFNRNGFSSSYKSLPGLLLTLFDMRPFPPPGTSFNKLSIDSRNRSNGFWQRNEFHNELKAHGTHSNAFAKQLSNAIGAVVLLAY